MHCHLYILKNSKGEHYIGITAYSLVRRLKRHNQGDVASIKFGRPWQVVYFEEYNDYRQVHGREKQIKGWHDSNVFTKLLCKAAGSSKGRTWAFEAQYLGSNPSPAALRKKKFAPPFFGIKRGKVGQWPAYPAVAMTCSARAG